MKTQDFLKELKSKNIRVPENWAVLQSSTGDFLGFMSSSGKSVESFMNMCSPVVEKIRAEREAIKESKLSQL